MDSVELRGGVMVPGDAIRLIVDLEARDHVVSAKDGKLLVTHGSTLTPEDWIAIKRWRVDLLKLVAYVVKDVA